MEIPKNYDYISSEKKWIDFWEEHKFYYSTPNSSKPKYTIVIPPPNITGILHIGHILNNTIQDIYCRWKRMSGFEVCWVPGTDHAGIGTQIVIEKELAKQGKTKYDLGREEFIRITWEWKEEKGGHILKQLRKLGASLDWTKERFTMDEGLSKAVRSVFVDLFKKGLIYKGKRIINWDPKTLTAVSDDEIYFKEQHDKLYYVRYPVKNSDDFITIATARPETMFGDVAVAVNPDDERYKEFIGKNIILPIVNKEIPVIADDYVDVEFGTGALKITPAHDLNDFEIGLRHNLEIINVLTPDAKLNEYGLEFKGLDVSAARKKVVERLKELSLLEKEDDYVHNVSFTERSGVPVEPYLSDQWFVSMKKLAEPAIQVVENEQIKFYPEKWYKTYMHWMKNVRDWCISRQLWWGHQIPVWYHKHSDEIYCEMEPPKDIENWTQDEDVLDTWFSSWIWPFSVFGWENSEKDNDNADLKYYYPTDLLVTGPDIIYLWVARMIMSGLEYMHAIPFTDVYFTSIVRDDKGRKMSKSLGNSPEPLDIMNKYGTDALRFTLVYLAPLGNDVLFDEQKTEIGRNFITKIWNAGRYLMMNKENIIEQIQSSGEYGNKDYKDDLSDKWIRSRFNSTLRNIEYFLTSYRLNDYTKTLYAFIWSDFCDWYIEFLKIKINNNKESAGKIIDDAIEMYINILKCLHPVTPFVTEEMWHYLNPGEQNTSISVQNFPEIDADFIDAEIENEFESLKEIVGSIRNLKAENGIALTAPCHIILRTSDKDITKMIDDFGDYIKQLCFVSNLEPKTEKEESPKNSVSAVLNNVEVFLMLEGLVDFAKVNEKIYKEIENLEKYLDTLNKKLNNNGFTKKASSEIVEREKQKRDETNEKLDKLRAKVN